MGHSGIRIPSAESISKPWVCRVSSVFRRTTSVGSISLWGGPLDGSDPGQKCTVGEISQGCAVYIFRFYGFEIWLLEKERGFRMLSAYDALFDVT